MTVAVAVQRDSFGVVHYSALSSNGKTDRRKMLYSIRDYGGELRREGTDDTVELMVSEYTVPVAKGRTQHGLQEHFSSLLGKNGKPLKVQVEAPGTGIHAVFGTGSGQIKPMAKKPHVTDKHMAEVDFTRHVLGDKYALSLTTYTDALEKMCADKGWGLPADWQSTGEFWLDELRKWEKDVENKVNVSMHARPDFKECWQRWQEIDKARRASKAAKAAL